MTHTTIQEKLTVADKNCSAILGANPSLGNLAFETDVSRIGTGMLGTKVETLLSISHAISKLNESISDRIVVRIPHMHVIGTDFFDSFMAINKLYETPFDMLDDDSIATVFMNALLPTELILQLYALVERERSPLAVRASRMNAQPFSSANSVHHCKMIPNNQNTMEERADELQNAVKLIYATTFFKGHRERLKCMDVATEDEKTAVIIQKVMGKQHGGLFFPTASGTIHSCNFYPQNRGAIYSGSASLVLGLKHSGISDKDKPWCFPLSGSHTMPFNNAKHKLSATQNWMFGIDMRHCSGGNPCSKWEYIKRGTLADAEIDPDFSLVASTYRPENDRFTPGTGYLGPRVVDFAPLLDLKLYPIAETLKAVSDTIESTTYQKTSVEFTLSRNENGESLDLSLLDVQPLCVHSAHIAIPSQNDRRVIVRSKRAIGNGVMHDMRDVVFVDPTTFTPSDGPSAVRELSLINDKLMQQKRHYILIAMGRIGTSDPFRGLQVAWYQVSGARVFIETDLPNTPVSFSGGSHFFNDLVNCGSFYFYVPLAGEGALDFDIFAQMPILTSGRYVKHVQSDEPLKVMVDGRTQQAVIRRDR